MRSISEIIVAIMSLIVKLPNGLKSEIEDLLKEITIGTRATLYHVAQYKTPNGGVIENFMVEIPFLGAFQGSFMTWNKTFSMSKSYVKDGEKKNVSAVTWSEVGNIALAYFAMKLIKSGMNTMDVLITEEVTDFRYGNVRNTDVSRFQFKSNHPANATQPEVDGLNNKDDMSK